MKMSGQHLCEGFDVSSNHAEWVARVGLMKAMRSFAVIGVFLIIACGCASTRTMMPTPSLYGSGKTEVFGELPPELTSTEVELLYVTDRAPETDEKGNLRYGSGRSYSLAVGTTVVDMGEDLTWEQLVSASRTQERISNVELKLVSTTEFDRLPATPVPYVVINNIAVDDPAWIAERDKSLERLRAEMLRRLALTPRKDVFLYVHGYHNTFEDAAFALAELWHFFGREDLPLIYTWPAGFPGPFGYTYDRESSEFTVYHLKQVISWLSAQPEIENIHLIAHSRGTDVATTALRELVLAARGAGISSRKRFKIANLVLAAPDLDLSVVSQRVMAERLGIEVGMVTLYASPEDRAIGMAERVFASPRGRLGTLKISELNERELATLKGNIEHLTIVNFKGESKGYGHSYFRTNPAVSSDLVLLLRYGYEAGSEGRPLEHIDLMFWRIPSDYPAEAKLD